MVTVPAATPDTTPVPLTVASAVLLLLHTPPVVASLRASVVPAHRAVPPDMFAGAAGMVTTDMVCVTWALPQLVVMV